MLRSFETPDLYLASLSLRQWRLVVSALSESGDEESRELAEDLLRFVLPREDC
jgi:hypothetical protein